MSDNENSGLAGMRLPEANAGYFIKMIIMLNIQSSMGSNLMKAGIKTP